MPQTLESILIEVIINVLYAARSAISATAGLLVIFGYWAAIYRVIQGHSTTVNHFFLLFVVFTAVFCLSLKSFNWVFMLFVSMQYYVVIS